MNYIYLYKSQYSCYSLLVFVLGLVTATLVNVLSNSLVYVLRCFNFQPRNRGTYFYCHTESGREVD